MPDDDLDGFFARLSEQTGLPRLAASEADAILDLARVVAHSVERKFAPLTSYLAGLALDASLSPAQREERVRVIIAAVRQIAEQREGSPGG